MAWVVDTSVLLDVQMKDAIFGISSAKCLDNHLADGLVISPMTYVELSPAFGGDARLQEAFLEEMGIDHLLAWSRADAERAHRLWADHVQRKRAGKETKRPIADIFIQAFAKRFQGIITRNPKDFQNIRAVTP